MTLNVQYLLYLLTILSFDYHYTGLFSFCQSRFLFFSFYLSTFFFFLIQNVLCITTNRMYTLRTFYCYESKRDSSQSPSFTADNRTWTCTLSDQNLNLARLPIPPYPHNLYWYEKTYPIWIRPNEASGIRTPDNLIKSQVLYRLS